MSSQLDAAVLVGLESTYGTAVALTRGYEAQADSFTIETEQLESVGLRAGQQTIRSDRRKVVELGGEGAIEMDLLSAGNGLIMQAMLGTVAGPTADGTDTSAYTVTHTSDSAGPAESFTIQVQRPDSSGTIQSFTHHGCMVKDWAITQGVNEYLKTTFNFDFEEVETDTADGTPVYPADASTFDWTQCVVTVDGSDVDATSFEVTGDLGLKTDRYQLRGSNLKKQPVRAAIPSYEGTVEAEFQNTDLYDLFIAGTPVEITATWTGALIEGTSFDTVTVTLPACQFNGDSPAVSLEDIATISLPFKVLDDGTNPAVTITVESADSAL